MSSGFLPRTDAGLLAWSLNFSTLITATPTAYGLVAAQATAYATAHTAFATAMGANDPGTRSKATVAAKNTARASLVTLARAYAKLVEGTLTVTNQQKEELGLTVRSSPQPIPVPSSSPVLEVLSVNAWTVNIKLHEAGSGPTRGKPAGVSGASIFSFVGAAAPTDISEWKFEGNTGRTNVQITFPSTNAPGSRIWLTAFWFNGRKQSGPACVPVGAYLQGGSVSLAA